MRRLLTEAAHCDGVSDMLIVTEDRHLAAHRFIVFSKSPKFRNFFEKEAKNERVHINVPGRVMEQFLLYLYTNTCNLSRCSADHQNDGHKKKIKEIDAEKSDLCLLRELAKRFGVKSLQLQLETGHCQLLDHSVPDEFSFSQSNYPHLYDINIQCSDRKTIPAHRCILTGRLEFFRTMLLSGYWIESGSGIIAFPIQSDIARPLIDYLYTDRLDMCEETSSHLVYSLLIAADQFLIDHLHQICQAKLASSISLQNATELVQFAEQYNAEQLRASCIQFICLNLAAFIDMNALQSFSQSCLQTLGQEYRKLYPIVGSRLLTPANDSNGILEEMQVIEAEVDSVSATVEQLTGLVREQRGKDVPSNVSCAKRSSRHRYYSQNEQPLSPQLNNAPTTEFSSEFKSAIKKTDVLKSEKISSVVTEDGTSTRSRPRPAEPLKNSSNHSAWRNSAVESIECMDFKLLLETEEKLSINGGQMEKNDDKLTEYFAAKRRSDAVTSKPVSIGEPSWCSLSTSPNSEFVSLKDIMTAELASSNTSRVVEATNNASASVNKPDVSAKKYCWDNKLTNNISLADIQNDELIHNAEWAKQTQKSLELIQLEEQAMQELLLAYGAMHNYDELITVERVLPSVQNATPICWTDRKK